MDVLSFSAFLVFACSVISIASVFFLYASLVWLLSAFRGGRHSINDPTLRLRVSLVCVVHNAEDLIREKISNSLSLSYPSEKLEVLFFSDGSTDKTEEMVRSSGSPSVRLLSSPEHRGKNFSLNDAVNGTSGEILVFSDVDAMLERESVIHLVKHFAHASVGGVCGRRIIAEEGKHLNKSQSAYIRFDTTIKLLESRSGSISSNDGKLYAIRKSLFRDIPAAVADDLYICLSVLKQGFRFIFEPEAKAFIRLPSRSPSHEVLRRRRIVSTSLRGIFMMRELLNPLRFGMLAFGLLINKVFRRMLPFFLLAFFITSLFLWQYGFAFRVIVVLQVVFYLLALLYLPLLHQRRHLKFIQRISSLVFYFCVGNYGTLLGVLDFLRGKQIAKWEPLKSNG